jgi:hypothetical protein
MQSLIVTPRALIGCGAGAAATVLVASTARAHPAINPCLIATSASSRSLLHNPAFETVKLALVPHDAARSRADQRRADPLSQDHAQVLTDAQA